jgi:hypothetical protein
LPRRPAPHAGKIWPENTWIRLHGSVHKRVVLTMVGGQMRRPVLLAGVVPAARS